MPSKHEEPHGETAEPKQLGQQDKLGQVMHRRVDPSTTLGQQHAVALRRDGSSLCIGTELGLERREVFEQERRQEPILAEREQVLLVQRVHERLGVLVDDPVRDDDGSALVRRAYTV